MRVRLGATALEIMETIEADTDIRNYQSRWKRLREMLEFQRDACPKCEGEKYLGSAFMPRPCDACNATGKREK